MAAEAKLLAQAALGCYRQFQGAAYFMLVVEVEVVMLVLLLQEELAAVAVEW
jgi:hypothetical protein